MIARQHGTNLARLISAGLLAVTLMGCLSFGIKTSGAATVEDLAAENNYKATYAQTAAVIASDEEPMKPTASSPGVCNKGGTKQGCHDTDSRIITDLNAQLAALNSIRVPPRFVDGDKLLRDSISLQIQGLTLRNHAIEGIGDGSLGPSNDKLQQADSVMSSALAAFPSDNSLLSPP